MSERTRLVGLVGFALLLGCQPRGQTANRYSPTGYGYPPPQQQWQPAPEQVWANYRPPPPRLPPQSQPLGGVRQSFIPEGMCLPGFAKNAQGTCILGGGLVPALGTLMFPWLQPQVQGPVPTGQRQVTQATVLVESLLVNTAKHDGRCWDPWCNERQSRETAKLAAAAAVEAIGTAASPYAAAFAILAPMAGKAMSHPDAAGWAYVAQDGRFSEPSELKVRRDTITPQWGLRFDHVPISPGTVLRLELVDADPDIPFTNGDDDMGIININAEHLVKAMQAGETHQVHVASQTHEQVLFVGISVLPEG